MAVYRCEVKRISRSSGRSSVVSAAYRAAERLRQEANGVHQPEVKVHDYRRRAPGVAYREVMAGRDAPEWARQRGRLWNEAEHAENRKNSVTAREAIVSLPHELDDVQRIELVRGFASRLIDRYGVAVDLSIHRPDRKGDQRNHHAHLMFTTRRMGPEGFTEKTRELDDRKTGPKEIEAIRELWEQEQNLALERAGQRERVSRLSNAEQGIERAPQEKVGEKFTAFARQGVQPRAVPTWQEVARRHKLRKDENRPVHRRRHRLEREAVARKYQRQAEQEHKRSDARRVADDRAMRENAARVQAQRDGAVSKMRANMAAQAERKRAAREAEKQEAVKRALDAAAQAKAAQEQARAQQQREHQASQRAEGRIGVAKARDTTELHQGHHDLQEAQKEGARKLDEERQRSAEVSAARAWEKQRQEELRRKREALEQQNQNPHDLGRVLKPKGPGES